MERERKTERGSERDQEEKSERERDREKKTERECVCMWVRDRERETERERQGKIDRRRGGILGMAYPEKCSPHLFINPAFVHAGDSPTMQRRGKGRRGENCVSTLTAASTAHIK